MTINGNKELTTPGQPLLLAEFSFVDGSTLRLSTTNLGGSTYAGSSWTPRLLDQNIAGIQMLSDQGIDVVAEITLSLADADGSIWDNWERPIGFKGATLRMHLVLYDASTATFSGDERVAFVGICNAAQTDESVLRVTAQSRMNMSRIELPSIRIQRRCPWIFPTTAAQRQSAADDAASVWFPCGYSPDATGGNARGNRNSNLVPYASCNYTFEDCLLRLGS